MSTALHDGTEQVVLVDTDDQPVGTMDKLEAHRKGVLHRAFSVFLFDDQGRVLLQQRAWGKYHTPGLWSNACCSHVRPGETLEDAAHRRLYEELGVHAPLERRFHFIYRAEVGQGLIEHEVDHVFTGACQGPFHPAAEEVADLRWVTPGELEREMSETPERFTPWLLIAWPRLQRHLVLSPT